MNTFKPSLRALPLFSLAFVLTCVATAAPLDDRAASARVRAVNLQKAPIVGEDILGTSSGYSVVIAGNALAFTSETVEVPLYFYRGSGGEAPAKIQGVLRYRADVLATTVPSVGQSEELFLWYGKRLSVQFLPQDDSGFGSVLFRVQDAVDGRKGVAPSASITTLDDQRAGGDPEEQLNPFPLGSIRLSVVAAPDTRSPLLVSDVAMETSNNDPVRDVSWLDGYFAVGSDIDNDGIDNGWEAGHGLNSQDPADALTDLDGDGLLNLQEFLLELEPAESDALRDFYVAADGDDPEGEGTAEDPWRTVEYAVEQASRYAAPFNHVTVHVGPGSYVEHVALQRYVVVEGAGRSETSIVGDTANVPVVEGEANAGIQNLAVTFSASPGANPVLVRINDVPFRMLNVAMDGLLSANSTGVVAIGQSSSGSFIADSEFRLLEYGLHAYNSGVSVARNLFQDIGSIAVWAEGMEKADTADIAPLLGAFPNTERSGLNRFRSINGDFVVNDSPAPLPSEMNDWGLYTVAEVQQRVTGLSDVEPIVTKSLGPSSVVVTVKNGTTNEVLPKTTPADVEIQLLSLQAEMDDGTGLYVFGAVPNGNHTIHGQASGIGTGNATADVEGLSVESVTLPLTGDDGGGGNGGGCRAGAKRNGAVALGDLWVVGGVVTLLAALGARKR